ncbi:MAG: hypothetical protein ACPG5B_01565 [Chitinophagales bacterium]
MNNQVLTEINNIIVKLPEAKLQPILDYLKELEKNAADEANTENFLKKTKIY